MLILNINTHINTCITTLSFQLMSYIAGNNHINNMWLLTTHAQIVSDLALVPKNLSKLESLFIHKYDELKYVYNILKELLCAHVLVSMVWLQCLSEKLQTFYICVHVYGWIFGISFLFQSSDKLLNTCSFSEYFSLVLHCKFNFLTHH